MSRPPPSLSVRAERWPVAGSFAISRGAKTEALVLVAQLDDGTFRGRGECVPYGRYGETVKSVMEAMADMAAEISRGLDRFRARVKRTFAALHESAIVWVTAAFKYTADEICWCQSTTCGQVIR